MSITEIYEEQIKPLPPAERLRLATLILNGIPAQAVVDERSEWSDEDLVEFAQEGWRNGLEGEANAAGR
jgi:hypothetical protein